MQDGTCHEIILWNIYYICRKDQSNKEETTLQTAVKVIELKIVIRWTTIIVKTFSMLFYFC